MINYLLILLLGQKIVRDVLQVMGIYSEKRIHRFTITVIMLLLTIADSIYNRQLKPEVLGLWLASGAYEGWRITKEKQLFNQPKNNADKDSQ